MSDTTTLPNVGDKVRAIKIPSIVFDWAVGAVVQVKEVDPNGSWYEGSELKHGARVYADFLAPDGSTRYYYISQWEPVTTLADVTEPQPDPEPELTPEQARIKALETEVHDLKVEIQRVRSEAVATIATIGEVLIDESNNRGWCDEFDRLTEETNERLPAWLQLPVREQEYVVTWTDYISVAVPRSNTVMAKNYDAAIREAQDCDYGADIEEIYEALRCGGWECNDSSDFEAELN